MVKTIRHSRFRHEERAGGKLPAIVGYSAVFNSDSVLLGDFIERIRPGAFANSLRNKDDVVALFNHDDNQILGRNTAGTLTVREDQVGLALHILPVSANLSHDIIKHLRAKNLSKMSFAFHVIDDDWTVRNGVTIRTLNEVKLIDVSVVTHPAYPAPSVGISENSRSFSELENDSCFLGQQFDIKRGLTGAY